MKPIKMFSFAALLALMAMAFVGISSAMAAQTALCSSDATGCTVVKHVHETTLSGHKAVLKTNLLTVECEVLFLGDTVEGTNEPLAIKGNFTYSSCTSGCTVTEENGPTEIKVNRESHETAKVTGEGLVHVSCSGLNCRYNGTGLAGTAKGPLLSTETNGEVSLVKQSTNKESGTFCPSTSELTITTTPLEKTYIVEPVEFGAVYCVDVANNTGEYSDANCQNLTPIPMTGLYQREVL
jgi:hypothetical protein